MVCDPDYQHCLARHTVHLPRTWFATVSDMFPKRAVATVTGIGGMGGAVGGILIAKLAGGLFDHYKALGDITVGYGIMFIICATAYIISWGVMQWLAPNFRRVEKL